jgi:conjugal transfer ATP-binding protein TraC
MIASLDSGWRALLARIERRNLVLRLPYWDLYDGSAVGESFRTGAAISERGKAEVGLTFALPASTFASSATRLHTSGVLRELLRGIVPEGERLRLVYRVGPGGDGDLRAYEAERSSSDLLSALLSEGRRTHLERAREVGALKDWQLNLSLTCGPKRPLRAGFAPDELRNLLREGHILAGQAAAKLKAAGWRTELLGVQTIYELASAFVSAAPEVFPLGRYQPTWQRYPASAVDRLEGLRPPTLAAQLGTRAVSNASPECLRVGDTYVKILTLYTQPDRCPPETGDVLSGVLLGAGTAWLILDLVHLPYEKTIQMLRSRSRMFFAFSSAAQAKGEYVDETTSRGNNELKALLEHLVESGDRIYSVGCALVLQDTDRERLEHLAWQARNKLSEIPGSPFRVMGEGLLDPWLALCPFSTRANPERVLLTESNAANLIPKVGDWPGSARAVALFQNRFWSLTRYDFFDPRADNWNMAFIGTPGSGKSFAVQRCASEALREGRTRVVFLDLKDTYEALVAAYVGEGAYLKIKPDGTSAINPMDLEEGELEASPEHRAFLFRLLRRMVQSDPDPTKAATEDALLNEAIAWTYRRWVEEAPEPGGGYHRRRKPETLRLTHLRETLLAFARQKERPLERDLADSLAKRLENWLEGTPAGLLFDRPTSVPPLGGKRVIAFDLGGLKDLPGLLEVGLLLVGEYAWRLARRVEEQTILGIDEAWALLGDATGYAFVEEKARLGRSFNTALWLVVHDPRDLDRPGTDQTISNYFLCRFDDQRFLTERLGLPEGAVRQHRSLTAERGSFNEALLIGKRQGNWEGGVVVLSGSRLEYFLTTSHAPDKLRRAEALRRTGGNYLEAARILAEEGR